MLEFIILGFLMYGERSGYDLKQCMTNSTSYFFDASFGSIYPALKRLDKKGMITFREVVEGNKYKKVYQISGSGKTAFLKWIEEPIEFEKSRHDHLVKIFFYEFLPKEKAMKILKMLIQEINPVVKKLTDQKDKAIEKHDVYQFYYQYSTMIYGIEFYHFVINWCKDLIRKLENDPKLL